MIISDYGVPWVKGKEGGEDKEFEGQRDEQGEARGWCESEVEKGESGDEVGDLILGGKG